MHGFRTFGSDYRHVRLWRADLSCDQTNKEGFEEMNKEVFVEAFELVKQVLTLWMPDSFLALPEVNFIVNLVMFGFALYATYFFIVKLWVIFGKMMKGIFRGNRL